MFSKHRMMTVMTLGLLTACNPHQEARPNPGVIPHPDYPFETLQKGTQALYADKILDGKLIFTVLKDKKSHLNMIDLAHPATQTQLSSSNAAVEAFVGNTVKLQDGIFLVMFDSRHGAVVDTTKTPPTSVPLTFQRFGQHSDEENVILARSLQDFGDKVVMSDKHDLAVYSKASLLAGKTDPVWHKTYDGIWDETHNNTSKIWSFWSDAEHKKIYVASNHLDYHTSTLTSLNEDGSENWHKNVAKDSVFITKQALLLFAKDQQLFLNIEADSIYSFDEQGKQLWKSAQNAGTCGNPMGDPDGYISKGMAFEKEGDHLIYLSGGGTCFTDFNAITGKVRWSKDLSDHATAITILGNVLIKNDVIYVANRNMFAFELSSGKLLKASHQLLPFVSDAVVRFPLFDEKSKKIYFIGENLVSFDPVK